MLTGQRPARRSVILAAVLSCLPVQAWAYLQVTSRIMVFSYTATEDQEYSRAYAIVDGAPARAWVVAGTPSALDVSTWDPAYWRVGLSPDYSVQYLEWPETDTYCPFTVYYGLRPGYMPDVPSIHHHGAVNHLAWVRTTPSYFLTQPFRWNAVPTVSIWESWTGPWALGAPIAFTADAHDAEMDISDTCYLEYRWDWDSDGVWDTGWSTSSQATHAFAQPGLASVTVEVIDRGYIDYDGWGRGWFQGETWTHTVTNNVGSPVPEPASFALLACAIGGIGAMLRKRRK